MKHIKLFEAITKTFTKISKSEYNLLTCGEPNIGSDLHKRDKDIIEIQEDFIRNNWVDFSKSEILKLKQNGYKGQLMSMDCDWFDGSNKSFLLVDYYYIFKMKDEWFYLTPAGNQYYKCDQIDGVIDCLNSLRCPKMSKKMIKLFENSGQGHYEELSYDDYRHILYDDIIEVENIEDSEVESIKKCFSKNNDLDIDGNKDFNFRVRVFRRTGSHFAYCVIHKLSDDWYYVKLDKEKFYKCDQIQGLITLLNDKLKKN